jgi:hypothetical protein
MRKMHVTVHVDLYITAEDNVEVSDIIGDMEYNFNSQTSGAEIEDSTILTHEVTDSR